MDELDVDYIKELNAEIIELRQQVVSLTLKLDELQIRRDRLTEKALDLYFGSSYESEIDYDLGALN